MGSYYRFTALASWLVAASGTKRYLLYCRTLWEGLLRALLMGLAMGEQQKENGDRGREREKTERKC